MQFSKIICSICAIAGLTQISGYAAQQQPSPQSKPPGFTDRVQAQRVLPPNANLRATTSTNLEGNTVKTLRNQSTGGNTALTLGPDGSQVARIRMNDGLYKGFSASAVATPEGNWLLSLTTPTQELQGTLAPESIGPEGALYTYQATNPRGVPMNFAIAAHADGGVVITDRGTGYSQSYTAAEVNRLEDALDLPTGSDTIAAAVPMATLGQFLRIPPSMSN